MKCTDATRSLTIGVLWGWWSAEEGTDSLRLRHSPDADLAAGYRMARERYFDGKSLESTLALVK